MCRLSSLMLLCTPSGQASPMPTLTRGTAALQWQTEAHQQRPSQWLPLPQSTPWLNFMALRQPLQPRLRPSKVRHLQALPLLHCFA